MEEIKTNLEKAVQEAFDFIKEKEISIKAKFPRGCIRTLKENYKRWPYLKEEKQRLIACIIQLCDINRLNLNLWDISLTAGSVFQWYSSIPVVAVIETLIYEFGLELELFKKKTKFQKSINILYKQNVIDKNMKENLHKLRLYRNEIHLYLKERVAMYEGHPEKYNESVKILHELEKKLKKYWEDQK